MAAPPVSKLAETGQDRRADKMKSNMAAHQKFVMNSFRKMEDTSKTMMEMVTRNNLHDQARGIRLLKL